MGLEKAIRKMDEAGASLFLNQMNEKKGVTSQIGPTGIVTINPHDGTRCVIVEPTIDSYLVYFES
jgi:hypothetical protein